MGIQINGQTDTISAIDGGLTIQGASGNVTGNVNSTGISTFSGGIVISAGSTSAPSISPSGDSNTGVFFPAADTIAFAEGGVEAVRIDSSGRLGIGTTNPQESLDVRGNAVIGIDQVTGNPGTTVGLTTIRGHHVNSDSDYAQLYFSNSKSSGASTASIRAGRETDNFGTNLRFFTNSTGSAGNGSERLRITSSGNIGIGTSNPNELLEVRGTENQGIRLTSTASSGEGANLQWYSEQTGDNKITAEIESDGESTGGNLFFKTRSTGGVLTSRVKIDNNGYVTIYKDTSNLSRLQFEAASTRIEYSDASGHLSFYTNSSARVRVNYLGGFTPVTDNSQSLGTSSERWTAVYAVNGTIQTSDLREKTNVETSSLGTDFIKQLRPVSYKFKVGENVVTKDEDGETDIVTQRPGERTHWGFIAQEVKEVVDAAGVDFGGWILTDKDDPDSTQGLRYDQFIAPLTKALQEALVEIDVLKAKVAALEAQ